MSYYRVHLRRVREILFEYNHPLKDIFFELVANLSGVERDIGLTRENSTKESDYDWKMVLLERDRELILAQLEGLLNSVYLGISLSFELEKKEM